MRPANTLPPRALGLAALALLGLTAPLARADVGVSLHAEGAFAHATGNLKSDQLGWGGAGLLGVELGLNRVLGVDLPVGVVGLPARADQPTGYARATSSAGFYTTPGLRLRPLAAVPSRWASSLWIAGGAGVSITGALPYPAVSVRAGLDVPLGRVALGPYGGLVQVIDPGGGLAEDARIVTAGIHGSLEFVKRAARRPAPSRDIESPPPPPPPEPDRDGPAEAVDSAVPIAPPPVAAPLPPRAAPSPLSDLFLFPVGEAVITDAGQALLVRVAAHLQRHPELTAVRVAGHADDTGGDEVNLRLSERRARVVIEALHALGVDRARLQIEYFGKSRPRKPGQSAEARRENRRVEIRAAGEEGSR